NADSSTYGMILWLDAFCANVDRSWRNPNLLVWHGDVWVIDHGASLYFHHAWSRGVTDPARFAQQPWDISDHVLGKHVAQVPEADARARELLSPEVFREIVDEIPDEWLNSTPEVSPSALRDAYV